jgi:hypothetical protein
MSAAEARAAGVPAILTPSASSSAACPGVPLPAGMIGA